MAASPKLTRDGDTLLVSLSPLRGSPDFSDALAKVKDIPGSNFDWDTKNWRLPAEPAVAERVLDSMGAQADPDVIEWARSARQREASDLTTGVPPDADLLVPWATARAPWQPAYVEVAGERTEFRGLMAHQRAMVDKMAARRKIVNASDMGTGKCAMALSAVAEALMRYEVTFPAGSFHPHKATSPVALWGFPKDSKGLSQIIADGPGRWPKSKFTETLALPEGQLDGLLPDRPFPSAHDLAGLPKLIVCPTSVAGTWLREVRLWLSEEARSAVGLGPKARRVELDAAVRDGDWLVVNWEQLRIVKKKVKLRNGGTKTVKAMKEPLFEETPWLVVIGDEIHRAKNRRASQTQGLWRVRAPLMFGLSGTPLLNSPDELWSIMHWLWPKEYTSYWRFYEQYVDYYETYYGKVITGVRNPDALRFELRDRLVRQTQGEVLDLPGKGRINVPIQLTPKQRKLYKEAETALWLDVERAIQEGDRSAAEFARLALKGASTASLLKIQNGASRTVRLRQIMETPATLGGEDDSGVLDACVDRVMDSRPEPWVVFCEFKLTCHALVERLRARKLVAEVYTGEVSPKDRSELEDRFQRGEIDVLVGTMHSMYQGITLTAGHLQFWVSRDWTPAVNEQGEDRQNRIGQGRRVQVFIAQPENTVATGKVQPTLRVKERIVKTVLAKDHVEEETL